jgi:hypothetical protein
LEGKLNNQDVLVSPLMEALNGRRLLLVDRPDFGHALTAYALLHHRFARGIRTAAVLIDAEETRRKKEGQAQSTTGNPLFALDAFQDLERFLS